MKRFLAFAFFLFFFFTFSLSSIAQESWVINSFDSNVQVQNSGIVNVQEKITVDFGSLSKHGIFRDIPITYSGKTENDYVYSTVIVNTVTMDGASIGNEIIPSGAYVRLKIGDANRTISGAHTYVIDYDITGVLRQFDDHDELYLNTTGNNWDVPIKKATSLVTLSQDGIIQVDCYQGPTNTTEQCVYSMQSPKTAYFATTAPLLPGSGLTVVVGFTKGLFPIVTVAAPQYPLEPESQPFFTPLNEILFFIPIFLALAYIIPRWLKSGRDFWYKVSHPFDKNAREELKPFFEKETVVVEFDSPEKLRPAEIGVLMDERADTLDITATIIDLAGRGYLTIKEIKKAWVFSSTDYEFKKGKEAGSEVLLYEKELLKRLFDGKKEVKMSELKTKFYTDLSEVKKLLYQDIEEKKLFFENPEKVRGKYAGVGVVNIILGVILIAFLGFAIFPVLFFSSGIVISGIIILIFSPFMPRRTALGRQLYMRSKGYEMFLASAEKYRQQFFERKNMFNEILPYTIVYGVTEKFAKAFADLGLKAPTPTWYSGSRTAFNPVIFGSNMVTFSHAVSTSIQASPRSSGFRSSGGGFSGGGSSGGGFGGGGGGSW